MRLETLYTTPDFTPHLTRRNTFVPVRDRQRSRIVEQRDLNAIAIFRTVQLQVTKSKSSVGFTDAFAPSDFGEVKRVDTQNRIGCNECSGYRFLASFLLGIAGSAINAQFFVR